MFIDLLIIFIALTVVFLVLSIFLMEGDNPLMATPFIVLGWIFSVICTYGVWNIEYAYTAVNTTTGGTDFLIYSTDTYGDPYSYIFYFIFFMFVIIFMRVAFNQVKKAGKDM